MSNIVIVSGQSVNIMMSFANKFSRMNRHKSYTIIIDYYKTRPNGIDMDGSYIILEQEPKSLPKEIYENAILLDVYILKI